MSAINTRKSDIPVPDVKFSLCEIADKGIVYRSIDAKFHSDGNFASIDIVDSECKPVLYVSVYPEGGNAVASISGADFRLIHQHIIDGAKLDTARESGNLLVVQPES